MPLNYVSPLSLAHLLFKPADCLAKIGMFGDGQYADGAFLRISPSTTVSFHETGKDTCSTIKLSNITNYDVAFKIKCSASEKFKVRPAKGVLNARADAELYVCLKPGFPPADVNGEEFIIQSTEADLPVMSKSELNEFWRRIPNDKISEHKIRCYLETYQYSSRYSNKDKNLVAGGAVRQCNDNNHGLLEILMARTCEIYRELKRLKALLYWLLLLTILILMLLATLLWLSLRKRYIISTCINPQYV